MTVAFCSLMSREASANEIFGFCLNCSNTAVECRPGCQRWFAGQLGLFGDLTDEVVLDRGMDRRFWVRLVFFRAEGLALFLVSSW